VHSDAEGEDRRILVFATGNPDKVRELCELADGLPVLIRSLADYPGFPRIAEDGATAEANAVKKASAAALLTGEWAAADDTALVVDALGGAPGVHAARYAGPEGDYEANNRKLIEELSGVPEGERTARFVTVAVLAVPGEAASIFVGEREGLIAETPRGENGFGYDPLFVDAELGRTFAELAPEEKNRISHRARAFEQLFRHLAEKLEGD